MRSSIPGLVLAASLACSRLSPTVPAHEPTPAPPAPEPTPTLPHNLLLIVADDLGTDKVGAYGEHPAAPPTPNIDRLAAQGVLFRNAYTYPTCSASRAALMTGRYGRRTGMGGIVELDQSTYELPLAEVLLPEVLDRSPSYTWSTAAVGKWHLSGHKTEHAFDHPNLQGFDHYAGCLGNLFITAKDWGANGNYARFEKAINGELSWVTRYATTDTTDDAITQLSTLEPPWLLYVAYNAPHTPFQSPPQTLHSKGRLGRGADDITKFDAMVEAMDREIGRLLAAMTPEQRRTTTVVFFGDNGTDRGAILPPLDPDHGKASLYEGGTNVPLIVSGPGVAEGAEAAALVHAVDLLPTLAQRAGIDVGELVLDGVSFASVLEDPHRTGPRTTLFTERFRPLGGGPFDIDMVALRDDRYKILRARDGSWQLFDLQGRYDDGEGKAPATLRGEERAAYKRLREQLDELLASLTFAH